MLDFSKMTLTDNKALLHHKPSVVAPNLTSGTYETKSTKDDNVLSSQQEPPFRNQAQSSYGNLVAQEKPAQPGTIDTSSESSGHSSVSGPPRTPSSISMRTSIPGPGSSSTPASTPASTPSSTPAFASNSSSGQKVKIPLGDKTFTFPDGLRTVPSKADLTGTPGVIFPSSSSSSSSSVSSPALVSGAASGSTLASPSASGFPSASDSTFVPGTGTKVVPETPADPAQSTESDQPGDSRSASMSKAQSSSDGTIIPAVTPQKGVYGNDNTDTYLSSDFSSDDQDTVGKLSAPQSAAPVSVVLGTAPAVESAVPEAQVRQPSLGSRISSIQEVLKLLSDAISAKKTYPEAARLRHIEGKVRVDMNIATDGSLKSVRIVEKSGSTILDRAAVTLVSQLFPLAVQLEKSMEVAVTIEYKLLQ
jgi:TonB family protein